MKFERVNVREDNRKD